MTQSWVEGVSVILPVHNAGVILDRFFENLRRADVQEVMVCDLKSTDDTVAIARNNGANVVRGAHPPHVLIREAAAQCRNHVLWFLSPCCFPLEDSALEIVGMLEEDDEHLGGFFSLARHKGGLVQWFDVHARNVANLFRRRLSLVHGVFCLHTAFDEVGGIPESADPLTDFARALQERGKVCELGIPMPVHFVDGDCMDSFIDG